MKEETFAPLLRTTREALDQSRLADAVDGLKALADTIADWDLRAAVDSMAEAYTMMLRYFRTGAPDTSRHSMFRSFLDQSYALCDRAERLGLTRTSTDLYYSTLRTVQAMGLTMAEAVSSLEEAGRQFSALPPTDSSAPDPRRAPVDRQRAEAGRRMFDVVWTSSPWTPTDTETARSLTASPLVAEADAALFVSALTMALLHQFDAVKFGLLLDLLTDGRPQVSSRAWVGLALITLRHDRRIQLCPPLASRLRLLTDDTGAVANLRNLQIQLLATLETREIEKQLQEDIIPTMLRNPQFRPSKLGLETLDEMLHGDDPNPEWRENEAVKRIEDKLKRLAEMQAAGADVYMGTFAAMKQQFPFFGVMSNWFLPFDGHHPDVVASLRELPRFMRPLFTSDLLCDSDKHSFALMLSGIPAAQRRLMEQQFEAMGIDSPSHWDDALSASTEGERQRRVYLQDLYRFFRLFAQHRQFANPFEQNLVLADTASLAPLLSDDESTLQVAEFAFRHKLYAKALHLYGKLAAPSADVFQKTGYCHQAAGQYDAAVDAYAKALLIDGDNAWTLRHMAGCAMLSGHFDRALDCWTRLGRLSPDDLQVEYRLGETLVHLGRYDEAFKHLYKVDYLTPDQPRTLRALAWCSFMAQKPAGAERFYAKLLSGHPTADDYMNAGHAAWASGDIPTAVERYRACLKARASDRMPDDFFDADAGVLAAYGLTSDDFRLLIDAINRAE